MNQEHRDDKRTDGASPIAWELLVRDDRTDWKRYNIYDAERSAQRALERVDGEPLQARVRPLYALEWVSVHERRPRIDGKTVYLGLSDQGIVGCFNALRGLRCPSSGEVYWHCDHLTDAGDTAVLSGLAYWMAVPVPELAQEHPG